MKRNVGLFGRAESPHVMMTNIEFSGELRQYVMPKIIFPCSGERTGTIGAAASRASIPARPVCSFRLFRSKIASSTSVVFAATCSARSNSMIQKPHSNLLRRFTYRASHGKNIQQISVRVTPQPSIIHQYTIECHLNNAKLGELTTLPSLV